MKKFLVIVGALGVFTVPVFAGPHGCPPPLCPGGWGPYPYGYWGCDRGLGNAAAITSIVANGIGMVSNIANTVRYQNQPSVTVVPAGTPVATTVATPVATPAVTVPVPPPVATPAVTPVTPVVYGGYAVPIYVNTPTVMPVMPPASAYRTGW